MLKNYFKGFNAAILSLGAAIFALTSLPAVTWAADSSANHSNPHCCPLGSAVVLADALKQSVLGGTANMTLPFLKAFHSRQIFVNQL